MKTTSKIAILVVGGSLLFSALSNAGHAKHRAEHFLLSNKAVKVLNLSQAQQDQIKNIVTQKRAAIKVLKMSKAEHKDEFKALVESDYFDEQEARLLIAKTSEAKNSALLAKLKSKQQIWQVLNVEQREKLAKIKSRKAKKHLK